MDLFNDVDEGHSQKEEENKLHFYYNREERIARAPKNVQDYYNGGMRPVRGIRVFFTKQNRYILFALIFFVGVIWVYTGFNRTRNYSLINGIDCNLQAFAYDEEVFTTIKFNVNKRTTNISPKKISAEIFLIDPNNQVSQKDSMSLVFEKGEEYLRSKYTDYDIIRVDVIVNIDGEEKELSCAVKR